MKNSVQILLVTALLGSILSLPAPGQQDSAQPGQEDAQSSDSPGSNQSVNQPDKFDPDDRPLSGPEDVSFGTPEGAKNVLNASLRADEWVGSNPDASLGTGTAWQGNTDVFGTFSLNRSWKRNSFTAEYDGGGLFYAGQDPQSVQFFNLSQALSWQRWTLSITDGASYSPESTFGIPGPQPSSTNYFGTIVSQIPNQSILTSRADRISNFSSAQLQYSVNRRASLTAALSYGFMSYSASGANGASQLTGTLGYNYGLSPHSTMAVSYAYSQMGFSVGDAKTDIQTANLSYAYQVTGRMSVELQAGAQLVRLVAQKPSQNYIYPDGNASLNYALRRTRFSLSVTRSIMSGIGLSVATNSTIAGLGVSHSFSHRWNGSANAGFAYNSLLGGVNQKYRSGFVGASLERAIGRHADFSVMYNFQRQTGNTFCTGPVCGGAFLRHTVGLGLGWHFTPVAFR